MKSSTTARRALALLLALVCLLGTLPLAVSAASVGTVKVKQTEKTTRTATIGWTLSGSVSGVELLRYNAKTKQYDSLGKTAKTAYKLKGLEPGADYLLAVRPYLTAGGKTTNGKAVKIRVYTAINAVPKITQTETTENSHKLNWKQINGAEKYEVYYYNTATKKFNLLGETSNNYVRMVNLKPAMVYQYRVRAISVASDGTRIKAPASKTFSGYTVPGAIKNFKAVDISTTGYRLQWDAVQNAGGYIVYRFDETTGQYAELAKTAVPSYVVRDLAPGTTEYYKICAYATLQKVNRKGAETAPQAVTTKPETVTPKFISGDPARAKLKIGWTPNENCDGYRIFATETEGKDLVQLQEIPLAATKAVVVKLPKKCKKTYVYMQTYIITDSGRVYSDYSSALAVATQPQTTTVPESTTAAQPTTKKAR